MQHEDDRAAVGAQRIHERDLVADVEVVRRLVHKDEFGLLRENLGDHDALDLAARHAADAALRHRLDADLAHGSASDLAVGLRVVAKLPLVGEAPHDDDVLDSEVRDGFALLRQHCRLQGVSARRNLADVFAAEENVTGRSTILPEEGHQGAFSRSVCTEDRRDLFRSEVDGHIIENRFCADSERQVPDREHVNSLRTCG